MNRSILKRCFCLLIAVLTALSVLPLGNIAASADTEVYLTDLAYESVTTIEGELSVNSNITVGNEIYEKGIYIHPLGAGDENAASIVYSIEGGNYKSFSVEVGKNSSGGAYDNRPMSFEIHIDGKLAAVSGTLHFPDKEKLEVAVPSGAKKLTLVAKAVGDAHYACGAGFGNPILSDKDIETDPALEKCLTDLTYTDIQSIFAVTDPYTTTTEGEPRIDNAIQIGTIPFEKGIYLHPVSAGGSAYVTYDISGLGFTSFRTYVGKDVNGSDWGNNKVQFEIYVDGILAAAGRELQYPSIEKLSVDLPAGARELKLVAKALSSHSATGCCFGEPTLSKKTTVEKSLTDLTYTDVQSIFAATDPYTTTAEGEPRVDNNIQIGTIPYDRGIYLHPVNFGGSAYITYDISGLGYTAFRTFVGKDSLGYQNENSKVQFEIYVDGVLAASSNELQYPYLQELSVDLPADAQELKLVARAVTYHASTGCCFGDPVLEHSHNYGEWEIDDKATFTSGGTKHRTCSGCGDIETEETAPAALGVYNSVIVGQKDDEKTAAIVGTIACEGLDFASADKLTYVFSFSKDGEIVKTVSGETTRIFLTVRGVASINQATAEAQTVNYVEGADYLFAVLIVGVPEGNYTVNVTVNAVIGDAAVATYTTEAAIAFTVT